MIASRTLELVRNRTLWLIFALTGLKLLLHLTTNMNYGFHRNEFLYLAMQEHLGVLAWQTGSMIACAGKVFRNIFGDSIAAVRLIPALMGAGLVLITGLLVREMQGGYFAQAAACLSIIVAPLYLRTHTFFQPVVFTQFFWTLACFLYVRWKNRPDQEHIWALLFVTFWCGVMADAQSLILLGGIYSGLLIHTLRSRGFQGLQHLRQPAQVLLILLLVFLLPKAYAMLIKGASFLPYSGGVEPTRFIHQPDINFLSELIICLNPGTLVFWIPGIFYFFISRGGRRYWEVGWTFLLALAAVLLTGGRPYGLSPALPPIFAAGAIVVERFIRARSAAWIKPVLIMILLLCGSFLAPYGVPMLPLKSTAKYMRFMAKHFGLDAPLQSKTGQLGKIPQDYADMLGWPEAAEAVAGIYRGLSVQEQKKTVILAGNYGEAGALTYYRRDLLLPPVISYSGRFYDFYYDSPGKTQAEDDAIADGNILISVGVPKPLIQSMYKQIIVAGMIGNPHTADRQKRMPVYLCRAPKHPLNAAWESLKQYR